MTAYAAISEYSECFRTILARAQPQSELSILVEHLRVRSTEAASRVNPDIELIKQHALWRAYKYPVYIYPGDLKLDILLCMRVAEACASAPRSVSRSAAVTQCIAGIGNLYCLWCVQLFCVTGENSIHSLIITSCAEAVNNSDIWQLYDALEQLHNYLENVFVDVLCARGYAYEISRLAHSVSRCVSTYTSTF